MCIANSFAGIYAAGTSAMGTSYQVLSNSASRVGQAIHRSIINHLPFARRVYDFAVSVFEILKTGFRVLCGIMLIYVCGRSVLDGHLWMYITSQEIELVFLGAVMSVYLAVAILVIAAVALTVFGWCAIGIAQLYEAAAARAQAEANATATARAEAEFRVFYEAFVTAPDANIEEATATFQAYVATHYAEIPGGLTVTEILAQATRSRARRGIIAALRVYGAASEETAPAALRRVMAAFNAAPIEVRRQVYSMLEVEHHAQLATLFAGLTAAHIAANMSVTPD